MGGLWVFFAIVQLYFYLIISSYGNAQERDHTNYEAGFDTKPLTNDIPMTDRAEPWNSRPSNDRLLEAPGDYTHNRSMSGQSVSTVMGEPLQREVGGYDNFDERTYPPRQKSMRQPANAYTQDPGPTPQHTDNYYSGEDAGAGVDKPMAAQAHPAEGSFRRKTPRLTKPETTESFDESFFRR